MTTSVIVVTLDRPDCLRRCLDCVTTQVPLPDQIIVVDSSEDDESQRVAYAADGVEYIRHVNGAGKMTASRNIALAHATSEIILFVDDDAYAQPGWLREMVSSFAPGVGAVGGRALRNQPGEDVEGVNEIGRLSKSGELTGYFAADPAHEIAVDHVMGCNMAFLRTALAQLGGMRQDFKGMSGVREDTDVCLRVARLGYRLVFNPRAVVDHAGAPQAKGARFDLRYDYYVQRNHCLLLLRNFGLAKPIMWRYGARTIAGLVSAFRERVGRRRFAAAAARLVVAVAGIGAGVAHAAVLLARDGCRPERVDEDGRALSAFLSRSAFDRDAT